jgi:hypothetical protein
MRKEIHTVFTKQHTSCARAGSDGRAVARPVRGANGSTTVTPARPERPDVISGLPPGEYYVVAVDDLPLEGARDAGVLEALVSDAARVTLTDAAPMRVNLRRHAFPGSAR